MQVLRSVSSFHRDVFAGIAFFTALAILIVSLAQWVNADEKQRKALADDHIQRWIYENIFVVKNQDGNFVLFGRDKPLRVYIHPESLPNTAEVKNVVESFAGIAGLPVTYENENFNLAIISSAGLSNNVVRIEIFKQLKLPKEAVDLLNEDVDWSKGCSHYNFADRRGKISVGIVFADSDVLNKTDLSSCAITGIIHTFGFRGRKKNPVRAEEGLATFLILFRSLQGCSEPNHLPSQEQAKAHYVACASKMFK